MLSTEDDVQALLEGGLSIHKLCFSHFSSTDRGLAASAFITRGETLLSVPLRSIINLRNIANDLELDWRALVYLDEAC